MISSMHHSCRLRLLVQRGVVLLVCLSLGLHWALLQSVAWTGMLLTNLRTGGVFEAVENTFDGGHPCPLCLAVKKGQQKVGDDSTPVAAKPVKKMEAVLVVETLPAAPEPRLWTFPRMVFNHEERRDAPPGPPPRGARAFSSMV